MVGLGKCASWFQRHSWLARIARRLSAGLSSRSRKKSWMSWPALQLSPAPASTSTFASGAAASSRSAAIISSCICGLIALRLSGRFIVTQAISSATSTFTVWNFEKSIVFLLARSFTAPGNCSNERCASFHLHAARLDHLRPELVFAPDERGELLGSAAYGDRALGKQALLGLRRVDDRGDLALQLLYDGPRNSRGPQHRVPVIDLEPLESGFRRGRNLGQPGIAAAAGDREGFQAAAPEMLH